MVDGTGNLWFYGDVAIKGGIISGVGQVEGEAKTVLDVEGPVVAPGFINTHSHSDLLLISEPLAEAKIMQGVTTEVVGQDGLGEAPIAVSHVEQWRRYIFGAQRRPGRGLGLEELRRVPGCVSRGPPVGERGSPCGSR